MQQAVGVIITNKEGKILLMQRGPKSRSEHGKWESAGGVIKNRETPEIACKRELKEELGVEVTNLKKLFETQSKNSDFFVHIFSANIRSIPSIQEPEMCSGIMWVDKNNLSKVELTSYSHEDFVKLGWIQKSY
jgi:mutator protein MutT